MSDFLFQMGLSNACFSLALAIVAVVVGATAKRPYLAHMLWVLVLVKLVTPPIVTIPVGMPSPQPDVIAGNPVVSEFALQPQPATAVATEAPSPLASVGARLHAAKPLLAYTWFVGSLFVFVWSMRRVFQFGRLLRKNTEPAPHQLRTAANTIAKQLGVNALPAILTTSARLSPMIWWAGGKVRVVIPASLLDEMEPSEWRWVLAHELAHVRRRDYLVRWLEWMACVCFWWNPVVWWAQRNLRAMEEMCCDALILSCLKPKPRSYANSILTAVELLACPAIRPPAMASEINSGGFLERRFRMIVSETPYRVTSRWLRACVLLCAAVVLPLGLAYAQDYEAVEKRLRAAVEAGELTSEQVSAMLKTLKEVGEAKKEVAKSNQETERAYAEHVAEFKQKTERIMAHMKKVKEELDTLCAAGKISREDVKQRYRAALEEAMESRSTWSLMKLRERLDADVEAGKISEETAKKIHENAERGVNEGREMMAHLKKVREELEALFEAGKISREDVTKRYE